MKIKFLILSLLIYISSSYSVVQYVLTVSNQTVVGNAIIFDLYIRTTNPADTIFLASSSWGWIYNNYNFSGTSFTIDSGYSANMKNRAGQEVLDTYYALTSDCPPGDNKLLSDLSGPDPANLTFFNQRVARISNQPNYHRIGRFSVTGISNYSGYFGLAWYLLYTAVFTYQTSTPFNTIQVTGTCESIPDLLIPVKLISTEVPSRFELYQNYPNPFNPGTSISFDLPSSTFANLKIFDIFGKTVETLVNEYLTYGRYNIKWDASKYSSGVYFYQLSTSKFVNTKKMILVK